MPRDEIVHIDAGGNALTKATLYKKDATGQKDGGQVVWISDGGAFRITFHPFPGPFQSDQFTVPAKGSACSGAPRDAAEAAPAGTTYKYVVQVMTGAGGDDGEVIIRP